MGISLLQGVILLVSLKGQLANADCTIGSNGVPTTETLHQPMPGVLYLDETNAANCTGTTRRLRYCYSASNSSDETLEARISLYRRRGNRFSRESNVYVITKSAPSAPSPACEYLDLGMELQIRENDMFGACIPNTGESEPLPIFSASAGASLRTTSCDSQPPGSILRSTLSTLSDVMVHIYADTNDVGATESPTMAVATSTADMSDVETTNQMVLPTSASDSTGVAVGIGVSISIVVLVLVTVIPLGVAFTVRRRRKKFYFVKQTSAFSTNGLTSSVTNTGADVHACYDNEDTYAEIDDDQLTASTKSAATHENPEYFLTQSKCSRGKNEEGYYCPNAVIYSDLVAREEQSDQELDLYQAPAQHETELYAQLTRYGITKINYTDLKAEQHLGSGQFGTVERGVWRRNGQDVEVAMKTANSSRQDKSEDKIKLLQEAAIMVQFYHTNVLHLYGVARQGEAIVVVMELAHKGDLRDHLSSLRKNPALAGIELPKLLLSFSQDIAQGMLYLSSKGFVHRDLAARNILVTADNTCKVADFGMSRDLFDGSYYVMSSGGKVPLRWTAPESLYYNKYSTASDVWSYGCVLYEIWSLGTRPYSQISNEECIEFVESGKRLTPPPGCPRAIYELMILCWHPDTAARPNFQDIVTALHANDKYVLEVPPEEVTSHHSEEAGRLGAPIECGSGMYQDLCNQYVGQSPVADGEQICNDYDVVAMD